MNASLAAGPLLPTDVRALPAVARRPYAEWIRIDYPRRTAILAEIAACHERQPYAAEPAGLLLVGPTGAGKTSITEEYARRYPATRQAGTWQVPVLATRTPSPARISTLSTALLDGLGDPRSDQGSIGDKTRRLGHYLRDCGTQLLILDELQNFVDRQSDRVLLEVNTWLKDLVKESGVACVLVGLQDRAEPVVDTDGQLARLFADPLVLAPFGWSWSDTPEAQEFCRFLRLLEAALPLREPSYLSRLDLAWRCWVASTGIVGYLMKLIRGATDLALLSQQESLSLDVLAHSYSRHMAGDRRGIANPFLGDPPPQEWKLPVVSLPDSGGRRRARGRGLVPAVA